MTMITPSYLGETIEYSSLHACRSTLEDPTGVWRGQELLPRGYVGMMAAPVAASGGQYGHGLVWLWGSDAVTPGEDPDISFGIPADTFWMEGHDGQRTAIIPSRDLVIVRLGLTPSRARYTPQRLVKAVLQAATN